MARVVFGLALASTVTSLSCTSPEVIETHEGSAGTIRCVDGSQPTDDIGTTMTSSTGENYRVELGDPQPWLPQGVSNVLQSAYEAAQSATVSQIAAPLADVLSAYGAAIPAVEITAEVTITHTQPVTITHTAQLQGRLFSDGRFDLNEVVMASKAGTVEPLSSRLICDGSSVALLPQHGEAGLVWGIGSSALSRVLPTLALSVRPLYGWLVDPFEIPMFEGLSYSVAVDRTTGQTVVTRVHDASQGLAGKSYRLDSSGPVTQPLSTTVWDPSGSVRSQVSFADHRAVANGTWRPFSVQRQEFLGPASQAADVIIDLTVFRARVLGPAELAVSLPADPDQRWLIWL